MKWRYKGHYKHRGHDSLDFEDMDPETTKTGFGFDTEHDAKNAVAFARFCINNKIDLTEFTR